LTDEVVTAKENNELLEIYESV